MDCLAGDGQVAQVAGMKLAALAHPVGRRAMVADADLPVLITQQPPDDRGADRSGAARHEHPAHQWVVSVEASSGAAWSSNAPVSAA